MKVPYIAKPKHKDKPHHRKVSIKDFENQYRAKNRTPDIIL